MYEGIQEKLKKLNEKILLLAAYDPEISAHYKSELNAVADIFSNPIFDDDENLDLRPLVGYIDSILFYLENNSIYSATDCQNVINKLENIFQKLKEQVEFFNEKYSSNGNDIPQMENSLKYNDIEKNLSHIKQEINQALTQSDDLTKKVKETVIIFKENKSVYDKNLEQLSENIQNLEKSTMNIHSKLNNTESLLSKYDTLQTLAKSISKSLQDSDQTINRKKLAASFQHRSKALNVDCFRWLEAIGAIVTMIILLMILMQATLPDVSKMNFDTLNIYIRAYIFHMPFAIILFWILWFCCKQYSYTCHLRDDYHYKYDLSTAFYGYNEEVKKLVGDDKTLQLALLDIVIRNIGKNPVENQPSGCNSPYAEILEKLKEPVDKLSKVAASIVGNPPKQ